MLLLIAACATSPSDLDDPLAELDLVVEDPSDSPIAGLDADWQARFNDGNLGFEVLHRESQGLGPNFIRASCASCHADDARGPGVVIKMTVPEDPEAEAELLPWGNTERPYVAGGASTPLVAPEDDRILLSTRQPPAVFGRGYLEAVADDTLHALVERQAQEGLVSGRLNEVPCDVADNADSLFPICAEGDTVIGRFGLKARIPSLDAFAADAYQGDMSITSALRPFELSNPDDLDDDEKPGIDLDTETLNLVADYMRLLALPDRDETEGAAIFEDAGCAICHVPTLPTRADWPVPQLAGIDAPVYTDMLLHDMGEDLSDGLYDHDAAPSEWRTSPLIGLRFLRTYLHDGSASTIEAAIEAHGARDSEAVFSYERYTQLSQAERDTLVDFVESL